MLTPSVVLDTNIVISALLSPLGLERLVYGFALDQWGRLFVSAPIFLEYETVLRRPKFPFTSSVITDNLAMIRQNSTLVHPAHTLAISPDERDNRFLECEEEAQADFLVTGNRRHYPDRWICTRIVGARELVEELTRGRLTTSQ